MRVGNWAAMAAGTVAVTTAASAAVVAVVGSLLIGIAGAQTPKGDPVKPAAAIETAKPADALSAMLTDARAAHAKTRDYSGTFTRQERINGTLGAEQVAEMRMRVSPVGVHVRFARPDGIAGMEVAYSAAKKDGKMGYRPAGAAGRKGLQKLDVDSSVFLADHRHAVTQWGMGPLIELIASSTAREKSLSNPVEVFTADYQFDKPQRDQVRGLHPPAARRRYAAKMVVFIDKETKLPIRFEAYGDAKPARDRRTPGGVQFHQPQVQHRHRRERVRLLSLPSATAPCERPGLPRPSSSAGPGGRPLPAAVFPHHWSHPSLTPIPFPTPPA